MPAPNPPQQFLCPITLDVMRHPVITTTCGHHFDRDAITAALAKSPFCPLDRTPLTAAQLVESRAMKELIEEWLAGNEQVAPPSARAADRGYNPRPLRKVMDDVPDIDDVISAQEAARNKVVWSSTQGEALMHFRKGLQGVILHLRWQNNRVPLPEFYASVHSAAESRQLAPVSFVRAILSALKKLPPTLELRRDQLNALLELDPFPERSRDIIPVLAPELSHSYESTPLSRSSSDRSSRSGTGHHSPVNTAPPLTSQLLQSHCSHRRGEKETDPARERRERAMRENKPLESEKDYDTRHRKGDKHERATERSDQRSDRSGVSTRTLASADSFVKSSIATRGKDYRDKDEPRSLQRANTDTEAMKSHIKQRKRIGIAVGVAAIAAVIGGGVGASR